MQDARNPDATGIQSVKNDVAGMLEAFQSWANFIASPTDTRMIGQRLAAGFQVIEIPDRLILSPAAQGVLADRPQVVFGEA